MNEDLSERCSNIGFTNDFSTATNGLSYKMSDFSKIEEALYMKKPIFKVTRTKTNFGQYFKDIRAVPL